MKSFGDLGIPFPLYEAPVQEANCYQSDSKCWVCLMEGQHTFRLGIGCALMVSCATCGTENGLDADDRQDSNCRKCESTIPFPSVPESDEILVCYGCLRGGKAAITKDTEFGMVSWDEAFEGRTHGVPGLQTADYETIVVDPDDEWIGVKFPKEHLFELLRTPGFVTWQGEKWLFCCQSPMTYVGEWKSFVNRVLAEDAARPLFDELMHSPEFEHVKETQVEHLWEAVCSDSQHICIYMFECKCCGKYRATWDMD